MGAFISGTKKYQDTLLEQADYKLPGWVHIFNRNFELLNDQLLKIQGLVDVDTSYLPDGGVLVWRAAAGKWVVRRFS
jgi:hypothetical protein